MLFFPTLLFLNGSCRVVRGERAEGAAGPCGRLREGLDRVYSAGGSHRGRSKIPEVWEYASGSIVCHMRRKINILFFPVTFCSLFLLGRSCLRLMCKPTVKERMSCSQQERWEP